ncbi:MAG: Rrf2 family transcriptional regulator [Magnetococcales bacterium]|nr:Rrf2 family transcriptional regulator [Magnetococcales bacterium]MBF0157455.1 Rrf2 family transcriptional regulator [Magnetococcales bacterium]
MLKFSKKLLYAIEAVTDIAYNSGGEPVQIREVTTRQGVPQRYLEQVMQRLVKAGILKGVRGPRGGYLLARDPNRISVGDIARVVMEVQETAATIIPEDMANGPIGQKVIRPLWTEFQAQILVMMDDVTVADLTTRSFRAGIPSEVHSRITYSI